MPVSYGILNPMVNGTRGRFTYDILTPVQFSIWYFDPGVNFLSFYFEPPHGKLNPPHFYQKRGVHNTIREGLICHR